MTDFKTIVLILLIIGVLDLTRRGHRHIRRRRSSLTVRENVRVGRNSWITFGHRVRVSHVLTGMAVLVAVLLVASAHAGHHA